jgi:hypothetical protein
MRRASIDHRNQAKKSFICLLIIFVTEKGLDKCPRAMLVDAVIDLVLLSPKMEKDIQLLTHVMTATTACSGIIVLKSAGNSFASGPGLDT